MRWQGLIVAVSIMVASTPFAGAREAVDHSAWDVLLHRHVRDGAVDYQGLAADRQALDAYLTTLRGVDVYQLPNRDNQLVFWINAYNASVITGVLDHYPLRSVKDIDGFFETIRYRVAGRDLTLNEIEQEGRALGDWRIHFAVVCASSSCPTLRSEAYDPERLDEQLTEQTAQFLQDPERGLRVDGSTLWVSKIFKWYTKDFVPSAGGLFGRLKPDALVDVLESYLHASVRDAARTRAKTVKYLDYDWLLNGIR